ncbi:MAG: hypothetical protein EWV53_18780 [Microcystis panniformis Mp_MB_F_20051200_S9]|uniref:Uncharacterized protein n=1 Tax=Microcystis panniformis Mp_MB_F_20051200_S9 TaxID=2486223 RepID=A0A552PNC7_9CHRO|nr:MAG: hypothetical protein EWV87_20085 [Microcystis panniformis Mp_GB_SS_20050300_S99]TRV51656.1 MAG: hypothetical protein EWV43_03645 [Microcystis panniformis Mp_MB_F_20080800_S26D]TRV55318.1 MAG: hypothetical protein EWV42_01910 [Microcystis panniformis Mp_GB_SS_20050300_S99D]TRV57966.1 MAG: hypothetical protein EWV69_14945 [Microcystis panniformis Mp_MB_F_20080800_S26]TRV58436.1 MAG: hypothetical protein EWV53_18780 [Microcystis panniformis Mp_MB_F_20051200_S9]TRV67188.1 MAG: hypothetical
MAIQPSECSIFIQIWVDTNAIQNGSTNGVYLVDNNFNNGSSQEGTTYLTTNATTNSKICWTILNTNINSDVQLSIANFSNASVFGAGGTPQQYQSNIWTGQVQANGEAQYSITFNAENSVGITTTVNPTLSVHS